jgi:HEAT repeat protein
VIGAGAFLALRLLGGLAQVVWWYITDTARVVSPRVTLSFLTALATAVLAVGVISIATGGVPRQIRIPIYVVAGTVCLFLGLMLDLMVSISLYLLSNVMMASRVPRYREQLLHGDERVRLHAAKQLATLGWRARPARPELLAVFEDESSEVRAAAAAAVLVAIPDPADDEEELLKAARARLTDPALPVRVYAAAILVACRAPAEQSIPVLIDGLKCEDDNIAGLATRALGQLGPAAVPAIAALRERIFVPESEHLDAIDTLQKIGEPAIPVLIEILDRGTSMLKLQAAKVLGEMGEPACTALPALRKLSIQRNSIASAAAQKAIKKLGGEIG